MTARISYGEFTIQDYVAAKHLKNVIRSWYECGWIEKESEETAVEQFHSESDCFVATLDESPECSVATAPGTIRFLDEELEMSAVTAVVTSRIARKRGLAKATLAHAVYQAIKSGFEVAALGMFEQGFYDQLGFGAGQYEQIIHFDPADLKKKSEFRIPKRLAKDDAGAISSAMKNRWMNHGATILKPLSIVEAELGFKENGFGLGYENDQGDLTHFFFGRSNGENGPLHIDVLAYQNRSQLLELFALLRSLGDQISLVSMVEPPHLQLQDLLQQPFRFRRISNKGTFENKHKSAAFCQFRLLDLPKCLAKSHLYGPDLEFNLKLSDPLRDSLPYPLDEELSTEGNYVIYIGEDCSATRGHKKDLPTLKASVGAFTRMWFGVRPASELSVTDEIVADERLLDALDESLRLPRPCFGWYF